MKFKCFLVYYQFLLTWHLCHTAYERQYMPANSTNQGFCWAWTFKSPGHHVFHILGVHQQIGGLHGLKAVEIMESCSSKSIKKRWIRKLTPSPDSPVLKPSAPLTYVWQAYYLKQSKMVAFAWYIFNWKYSIGLLSKYNIHDPFRRSFIHENLFHRVGQNFQDHWQQTIDTNRHRCIIVN